MRDNKLKREKNSQNRECEKSKQGRGGNSATEPTQFLITVIILGTASKGEIVMKVSN